MLPRFFPVTGSHAALSALVVCALGCSDVSPGRAHGAAPAREPSAVVDGELSGPGIEDAVLLLHGEVDGRELVCSAGLIAKNLVATARHCVSYLTEGLFSCSTRGELIEAEPGAGRLGTHLPANSFEFFGGGPPHEAPLAFGKEVLSTLSDTICTNDVAFVVLDRELDLPILPLRLGSRAVRGEVVTLVGYGLDETMDPYAPFDVRDQPRTRKAGLTIASVGPDTVDKVTTTPPRMIVLEGPSGCLGDSGGPLIDSETHALLGIYSLLDGNTCIGSDIRHLFGHLPSFPVLIDRAFEAAGAEPLLEGTPGSGGVAGAGGEAGGAGEAGNSAGHGGRADIPGSTAGAGGEPETTPGEGGAGGATEPVQGGSAGTPKPEAPQPKPGGGCSFARASEASHACVLSLLLLYAVRRRRFSGGCRADLLRALPRQPG